MEKRLYVVTGRIPYEEDCETHVVGAKSRKEAERAFQTKMNVDQKQADIAARKLEHGTSVFVISCTEIGQILPGNRLAITCGDFSGKSIPKLVGVAA